ncbi:unnamed protein product [Rhizophagus irregularis]|nr:unnamed protein product [Rhizophagus irregularis]
MGDFNLITNGLIDRTPPQHISRPKFFNDLEILGLINSYRKLDEEAQGNTYHKESVSTRIDQIWVSETHSNKLVNFSITPSTFITHSDHNIITLTMDTSDLIRNNRKNTVYDKLPTGNTHSRVIYDCDNIETERWDNFRLNIKNQLNSLDQDLLEDRANFKEYSQEDIDRYWDKLNSIIVYAADTELPRKDIRWTSKIAKYNQDYVTSTEDNYKCNITTHGIFSEEWFDTLKTKVNYRLRADYKKYKLAETKNTLTNIVIDKVLVNEETGISTKRLATELREVKKAVDNDFANMFRKRNTLLDTMTPIWRQIYEPVGKFKEVMESTIEKITMAEWNNTVKELNKELAAGLSGINYRIILQLPEELILFMVKFGNLTLQTGLVPMAVLGFGHVQMLFSIGQFWTVLDMSKTVQNCPKVYEFWTVQI